MTEAEARAAADRWLKYASDQEDRAQYHESRGEIGLVHRAKADGARQAAAEVLALADALAEQNREPK